jgi:hypothetical protein
MTLEHHSELSTFSELGAHAQRPADPAVLSVSCVHGLLRGSEIPPKKMV